VYKQANKIKLCTGHVVCLRVETLLLYLSNEYMKRTFYLSVYSYILRKKGYKYSHIKYLPSSLSLLSIESRSSTTELDDTRATFGLFLTGKTPPKGLIRFKLIDIYGRFTI
jgi:hypothetical protein